MYLLVSKYDGLVAGSRPPVPDKAVSLFAQGHNPTDTALREHVSFLKDVAPLPGRNLRVGVSYRF